MIPLGLYGAARPVASGPLLTLTASGTFTATATVAGVAIGAASASRTVVVMLAHYYGFPAAVSAMTIGGVSATADAIHENRSGVSVFRATVPTGNTADIVITTSSTAPTYRYAVYTAATALSVVASAGGFNPNGTGATSLAATVATAAGGALVAGVATGAGIVSVNTLDETYGGAGGTTLTGSLSSTTGASTTVTATTNPVDGTSTRHVIAAVAYQGA